MSTASTPGSLSPEDREALNRMLVRLARSADSVSQLLDLVDHLAESGNLAAIDGFLEDFDENFNAITRPDLMTMVANLMMLMGTISQIDYAPFFSAAMDVPSAVNTAYPAFYERTDKLSLREAIGILRSPEVAGALEVIVSFLRALRTPSDVPAPGA